MDESTILMEVFNGLITNVNSKLENGDTIFTAISETIQEANLTPADKKKLQILLNESFKDEIFDSAVKMVNDNKRDGIAHSDAVKNVLSYLTENNYLMGGNDNLRYDFLLYFYDLGDLQSEVNTFDTHLNKLTQGMTTDNPEDNNPITIPSYFSPENKIEERIEKLPLQEQPIYRFLIDQGFITMDTFQKQKDINLTQLDNAPGDLNLKIKVLQDTGLV